MKDFIDHYKVLRAGGCDPTQAFGIVAGNIAIRGNIKDLQALFKYHDNDFWNDHEQTIKNMEESNNERTTTAV